MRRVVVIGFTVLLAGSSAAAVRLSGHAPPVVAGPLSAGGSATEVRAAAATHGSSLRRLAGATVRMVRVRGPEPRTTLARATHPQFRAEREAEAGKLPRFVTTRIRPTTAYRARSEGTPAVNARIAGLDSTQGQADPPDVQVAAGPTAIVEMVNTVYAMWNRAGQILDSGPLDEFFTSSGVDRRGDEVTDPRVLYDTRSGRWFTALFDVSRAESLIGVSDTSDPSGGWKLVAFPFRQGISGACPDQPRLGLSDNVVVVGVDLFADCEGGALQGGAVIVVDKPEMLAGGGVTVEAYGGDTTTTQITPAVSLGPTGPDYLVSIRRDKPTTAFLYTVTDPEVPPTVRSVRITRMAPPPNAPQKGSLVRLDTGDHRVQNARWQNGVLTFVASDACAPGRVPLACARLAQISTANAQRLWEKELVLGGGRYLFYPVVESDGAGNLLLAFGYSSGTEYPGVGAATLQPNGKFSSWTVVQKGTAPHKAGRSVPRYGDYFGIGRDPAVPGQVWAAGEFGNGLQRSLGWGTAVFAMSAGSANAPSPAPTDRKRPAVRPRALTVRHGAATRLRFTLADNSGWMLVTAGVFRGKRQIKKFAAQELSNGAWFLKWKAPSKAATLRFCLSAVDAAGNASKRVCARVRVT